jgi:hypothetical protein
MEPMLVVLVSLSGVQEVQVHSPDRAAEGAGLALYKRLQPALDLMDRTARLGWPGPAAA